MVADTRLMKLENEVEEDEVHVMSGVDVYDEEIPMLLLNLVMIVMVRQLRWNTVSGVRGVELLIKIQLRLDHNEHTASNFHSRIQY